MSGHLTGNKVPCTPQQAAVFIDNVPNRLVTDMRPLSVVEDDVFRAVINILHTDYTVTSRSHLLR